ncbi:MAG: hypothetical protein U9R01_03040, partial [candidate division WOR-3 bacterium]|nr:hypothetical protein [candidate division WOR-3 bacterium]
FNISNNKWCAGKKQLIGVPACHTTCIGGRQAIACYCQNMTGHFIPLCITKVMHSTTDDFNAIMSL